MLVYGNDFNEDSFIFLKNNGLGIELTRYALPNALENLQIIQSKTAELLQGMSAISMHGAYYDLFYASKDPLIREVARKRTLQSVQAATYHSINHVVFHSSYRKFFDGFTKYATDEFLNRTTDFWLSFEDCIPDGMFIYLENVEEDDPEILLRLIEAIGSPKIQCCLDIGHAFINSEIPLTNWINVLGSHIGYVHIHDNMGKSDQHLPFGKGSIPLYEAICKIMEVSKSDVPFVLECDILESIDWLNDRGFILNNCTSHPRPTNILQNETL